jgi:serine protease Do
MSKCFAAWIILAVAVNTMLAPTALTAGEPWRGEASWVWFQDPAELLDEPPADESQHGAAEEQPGDDEDKDSTGSVLRRFWPRWRATDDHERNHRTVREAFRDVIHDAGNSTVQVICQNRRVAFGTIVTAQGLVLTKASELKDNIECRLSDGRRLPAELVTINDELDLALLHIQAENLVPVQWREGDAPAAGSWLVTVGGSELPVAVGVVSVAPRNIPTPRPILGVQLEPTEGGARVASVVPDSPAQSSGIQENDVIVEVNGKAVENREALISFIQTLRPGDRVELVIVRGEVRKHMFAVLTDFNSLAHGKRIDFQNSLGGPLSTRRWGFSSVLQHDTVLRPNDCGGPILDLEGRAVGINIARAGRVASYALPVAALEPVLAETRSGKYGSPPNAKQITATVDDLRAAVKKWGDRFHELQRMVEETREKLAGDGPQKPDAQQATEELAKLESAAAQAKAELDKALGELQRYENPGNTSVVSEAAKP